MTVSREDPRGQADARGQRFHFVLTGESWRGSYTVEISGLEQNLPDEWG